MVSTEPEVTVERGTTGVMPCRVDGEIFSAFWRKGSTFSQATELVTYMNPGQRFGPGYDEGKFNMSDDLSLIIHDVQITDEGRYYCAIVNDIEKSDIFKKHSEPSVYGMCQIIHIY